MYDLMCIDCRKNKAKAIQQKMFEDIAKKQQKLLATSNDEHVEEGIRFCSSYF